MARTLLFAHPLSKSWLLSLLLSVLLAAIASAQTIHFRKHTSLDARSTYPTVVPRANIPRSASILTPVITSDNPTLTPSPTAFPTDADTAAIASLNSAIASYNSAASSWNSAVSAINAAASEGDSSATVTGDADSLLTPTGNGDSTPTPTDGGSTGSIVSGGVDFYGELTTDSLTPAVDSSTPVYSFPMTHSNVFITSIPSTALTPPLTPAAPTAFSSTTLLPYPSSSASSTPRISSPSQTNSAATPSQNLTAANQSQAANRTAASPTSKHTTALSAGAIAGIAIAGVFVLALLALVGYFWGRRRGQRDAVQPSPLGGYHRGVHELDSGREIVEKPGDYQYRFSAGAAPVEMDARSERLGR